MPASVPCVLKSLKFLAEYRQSPGLGESSLVAYFANQSEGNSLLDQFINPTHIFGKSVRSFRHGEDLCSRLSSAIQGCGNLPNDGDFLNSLIANPKSGNSLPESGQTHFPKFSGNGAGQPPASDDRNTLVYSTLLARPGTSRNLSQLPTN